MTNILGALLGQVLVQMGDFSKELLQEYERHTRLACYSSPSSDLIHKLLIHASQRRRIILFVDALDELGPDGEQGLDSILRDLANSSGQLSIFAVSRTTNTGVQEALEPISHIRLEDHVMQVDMDIRHYVEGRLHGDRGFQWLSAEFRDFVLDSLGSRSQGM